jgi:putative spermidine/putrescine transport system permease protein
MTNAIADTTLRVAVAERSRAGRWARNELVRFRLLILLPLAFVTSLFVYPVAGFIWKSFTGGAYIGSIYGDLFRDELFLLALRNTFFYAFLTSILTAIAGYPVAILIGFSRPRTAALLLMLVMVPFWTSILVRSYAWLVILGREGLVNAAWLGLGLGEKPLQLIFNSTGSLIAMVHVMLPYMILPLVSTIGRIDKSVLAAASSLGANRSQSFLRVLLPMTMPGVAGGFGLVFVLSLAFFITPALMGGPRDLVTAMVIYDYITHQLAWEQAAAASVVLLAITAGVFLVFSRVLGLEQQISAGAQ